MLQQLRFSEICTPNTVVVTAEGRIDRQTSFGKGPAKVARLAKERGAAVVGVGGFIARDAVELAPSLFDALFSLAPGPVSLNDALKSTAEDLERVAEMTTRLMFIGPSVIGED